MRRAASCRRPCIPPDHGRGSNDEHAGQTDEQPHPEHVACLSRAVRQVSAAALVSRVSYRFKSSHRSAARAGALADARDALQTGGAALQSDGRETPQSEREPAPDADARFAVAPSTSTSTSSRTEYDHLEGVERRWGRPTSGRSSRSFGRQETTSQAGEGRLPLLSCAACGSDPRARVVARRTLKRGLSERCP